jgi:hypothetical protein
MNVEHQLKQQAIDFSQQRLSDFSPQRRRIEQLKAELAEAEARLASLRLVSERLKSFQARIGNDYSCLRCWIDNEITSRLTPIGSENDENWWRCSTCRAEFVTRS